MKPLLLALLAILCGCSRAPVHQTAMIPGPYCLQSESSDGGVSWVSCPAHKPLHVCAIKATAPIELESGAYGPSWRNAPSGAYLQTDSKCASGFAWYRP